MSMNNEDRYVWRPGDIRILSHPDPEVEKQLKEHQERARQKREQAEKDNKND